MSSFTVRPYERGDEVEIVDLFNRVFSEENPSFEPRTVEDWQGIYLHNPAGIQTFVAEDRQRRIIANYGALPAPAVVRGSRALCSQPVDTCVDRAFRGSLRKSSVFVTIARAFIEEYCREGDTHDEYMFGLPNDKAYPIGTRIVGYQPVHVPMPGLVLEFDAGTDAWLARLDALADGLVVSDHAAPALGSARGEIAALFARCLDEVPLGIWRDEGYLRWRYRDTSKVQYRALLARKGGALVGAAYYRLGWWGHPVLPLVDWVGPGADRATLAALLAAAARIARPLGGQRLETWVTPNMPQHATLAGFGFASRPSTFNLCIMTFSSRFDLEWAKANWFFTMGDSDIY